MMHVRAASELKIRNKKAANAAFKKD